MLFEHFVLLAAKRHDRPVPQIPAELLRDLMAQSWPGNVRELRNAADCYVLGLHKAAGSLSVAAGGLSLVEAVDGFERALIAAELQRNQGSLARTSEALKVAKTTLHDKIRKYGLQAG
jgi:two-component system C4-dicarboxylate transport response regulator DctD